MDYITLNNDLKMPKLGFGVFKPLMENRRMMLLNGHWKPNTDIVFDTAMIYGNEGSVGKAIEESGVSREDIFLTTKLWNEDIRRGNTMQAFEDSLKQLRTDYLDLYLIHWPADGFEQASDRNGKNLFFR